MLKVIKNSQNLNIQKQRNKKFPNDHKNFAYFIDLSSQALTAIQMQQIKGLKKINLQEYQKPKTLIVVHYKGKRISVPLLGECKNLTQMLYQNIDKFQQTVLRNDPKWEVLSRKRIVCFCSNYYTQTQINNQPNHNTYQHPINKHVQRFLKYSDGDLKIDLLLSLIRIENTNLAPTLDITKYYKYMEIQPYFVQHSLCANSNQTSSSTNNKYLIYRLLQKRRQRNRYLCRSLQDGHFYSLRVYRSSASIAQHQALFLNQHQECLEQNECQTIPKIKVLMIPSAEDEDQDQDGQFKHTAMIYKYFVRGTLKDRLGDKMQKVTQNDMLRWIKQLVGLLHHLHNKCNIIHTNLVSQNFQIDQLGNLKLVDFTKWLQCFDEDGHPIQYNLISNRQTSSNSSRLSSKIWQPSTSSRFIDHYSIGLIIKQLYIKVYQNNLTKQENTNKTKLIEKIIQSLMSDKDEQRENIVMEIIEGMQKTNQERDSNRNHQIAIHLNQIKLGQQINIETTSTCIQNQDHDQQYNAISHQEIINYFKPLKISQQPTHSQSKIQHNKKLKSKLKLSRGQLSNVSNSRQKSVKSMKSNKSTSKQKIRTFSKVSVQKSSKEKSQKKSKQKQKSPMHYPQEMNGKSFKQGGQKVVKSKQKSQKSESKSKYSQKQKQKSLKPKQKSLKSNITSDSTTLNNTQKLLKTNGQLSIPIPKKYKSPNK